MCVDITQTILILGFLATVCTILQNTKARKISFFHDMAKEERTLHMKILEMTMNTKRKKYKGKKGKDLLKKEQNAIIEPYLNFLENLALLVLKNKINKELSKEFFKDIVKCAMKDYKDNIYPDYKRLIELYKEWKD